MHEINVRNIRTNSPEFPVVRDGLVDRYNRLGRANRIRRTTLRREMSRCEIMAASYTGVVLSHTETIAFSTRQEHYASALALVRPALEATLKQLRLALCENDSEAEEIVTRQNRIGRGTLEEIETLGGRGFGLTKFWTHMKPFMNDFVHGGVGQLTSNNCGTEGTVAYDGAWIWTALLVASNLMLGTTATWYALSGNSENALHVVDVAMGEDWSEVQTECKGQRFALVNR